MRCNWIVLLHGASWHNCGTRVPGMVMPPSLPTSWSRLPWLVGWGWGFAVSLRKQMEILQTLSDRSSTQNAWKQWKHCQKSRRSRPSSIIPGKIWAAFPRNASVLILAPIAPALSGSSPALPLPSMSQCLADLGTILDDFLGTIRVENQTNPQIHGKVDEITRFIARCQTFRSIEDQSRVGEVTTRTQQHQQLSCCDLVVTSPCCRTGSLQSHTTWDDSEIVTGYLHVLYHLYHLQQDYVHSSVSMTIE